MASTALRVLIAHRPPLAFVDDGNTPQPIFSGYLVDLLPTLLDQAKVQSTYKLYAFQVCSACDTYKGLYAERARAAGTFGPICWIIGGLQPAGCCAADMYHLLMRSDQSQSMCYGPFPRHDCKRFRYFIRPAERQPASVVFAVCNMLSHVGGATSFAESSKRNHNIPNQLLLCVRFRIMCIQGPGGMLLRNGSWTGVMGELTTDKADMALFPLTLTSQRSQFIQHTQSFMDDGYGILVQTRQTDSGYSFLLPFEPLTWVLLLVALLAVMGIIWALDMMTRRTRLRAIERTHGVIRVQRVRRRGKMLRFITPTSCVAAMAVHILRYEQFRI